MKQVYLDHGATTALDGRVLEKMLPYLKENYGNANSLHSIGRKACEGLDEARDIVANLLGANFNEIYFTSGGTEGDNLALRGFTALRGSKNKLVTSSIEHSAIFSTAEQLEKLYGIEHVKVSPNAIGIVTKENFSNSVDENTYLVSLMHANNEIGTIQPIKDVCRLAHDKGAYFFTDSVQAVGKIKLDVKDLGVDMLSFSAHKFNGPKGVGCVYISDKTKLSPIITGGHQERSLRGGTSNVAGAIGLAYALKYSLQTLDKDNAYVLNLRNHFIDALKSKGVECYLNGDKDFRLSNNANLLFKGVSGDVLLYKLDMVGVCASLGAACSSGTLSPSHVLKEIGLSDADAMSSIRFTFGKDNDLNDVEYVASQISNIIKELKS